MTKKWSNILVIWSHHLETMSVYFDDCTKQLSILGAKVVAELTEWLFSTPNHPGPIQLTNYSVNTLNIVIPTVALVSQRRSITVRLTMFLFCLELAALLLWNKQQFYLFGQIETSQTGGQPYSDASPYGECSLRWTRPSFSFKPRIASFDDW